MNWMKLQNGSDIRGVAQGIEGEHVNLTQEVVKTIGKAFDGPSWSLTTKDHELVVAILN